MKCTFRLIDSATKRMRTFKIDMYFTNSKIHKLNSFGM